MNLSYSLIVASLMISAPTVAFAQRRNVNYDESKIDIGVLPDPLRKNDGSQVAVEEWTEHRKGLVQLLAEHQFGFGPTSPFDCSAKVIEEGTMHDGTTRRRQLVMTIKTADGSLDADLALFTPTKVPLKGIFFSLNFCGNHGIAEEQELRIPTNWIRNSAEIGITENRANEQGRGKSAHRWPIEDLTKRGYGVATVYYGDFDPDFDNGFNNGLHPLFPNSRPSKEHPHRWGAIGAWSWGLSRMVDVVEGLDDIKTKNFAVVGHSRLGKASLWAGATDERFGIVVSNNSGCGGAALERRNFGETVEIINNSFPHWFCGNFKKYKGNEKSMPHDAHFIIASIAPRPVYIASATEDQWADPKGEYLSGYYATPAYKLHGLEGLASSEPPAPETPVGDYVGYHNRTGVHNILAYDWARFMDFADRHWK